MTKIEPINFQDLSPEKGYVVAEVACGHEGQFSRIQQLVDVAVYGGARIIKFQIFYTRERAKQGEKEWDIFYPLTFNEDEWVKIIEYSRLAGLTVFADVYGRASFELATSLGVDGFKIHSEDLLNSYFIDEVCSFGKLTLLGIGGAKRKEIYELLNFLTRHKKHTPIILMPGVQTFPTPLNAHSIEEISELVDKYQERFHVKVGFADHIAGDLEDAFYLPIMALSKGAVLIEKHITVDRSAKWIDYQSALDRDDFRKFVEMINRLSPLLALNEVLTEPERAYRKMFKKTIALRQSKKKGEKLTTDSVEFIKNVGVTTPLSAINAIGKSLKEDVSQSQEIRCSDLVNKIGAIIVARMSSSRLWGKALLKIDGRDSIRRVIDRVKKCRGVETIILATSTDQTDDELANVASEEGISLHRGSLENVAERFYGAAVEFSLDHFVRVTGDAILVDNVMVDRAIDEHLYFGNDVTFMENMPFGTAKEIISVQTIETIVKNSSIAENTEYLEYYLMNEKLFNVGRIQSPYIVNENARITLDYEEDLEFFNVVFKYFNNNKREFDLSDVIKYLDENPDVILINTSRKQKYSSHEVDTTVLI